MSHSNATRWAMMRTMSSAQAKKQSATSGVMLASSSALMLREDEPMEMTSTTTRLIGRTEVKDAARTIFRPSKEESEMASVITKIACDQSVQHAVMKSLKDISGDHRLPAIGDEEDELTSFRQSLQSRIAELEKQVTKLKEERAMRGDNKERRQTIEIVDDAAHQEQAEESSWSLSTRTTATLTIGAVVVVVVALATKFLKPAMSDRLVRIAKKVFSPV